MTNQLQNFKDSLRKAGLKATPQRLSILQILTDFEKHPCADTIYDEIRKILPGMSRATVYSTLRSLFDAGIVQEVGGFGAIRRFDGNPDPHPHTICVKCNKVAHIKDLDNKTEDLLAELATSAEERTDYTVIKDSFTLYGYCPGCTKE